MTTIASSPAFHNLPFRWRRKVYMTTGHTISQFDPFDGASTSAAPVMNPTTGPSTGPCTHNASHDEGHVAQNKEVQTPQDGNSVAACCQEPEPEPSSTPASPTVDTAYTINYENIWGKLQYMQKMMEERKTAAIGERTGKENMARPPRPLKRKRAAPRPAPVGPVRQSKRLQQKGQGRGKE